MKQKILLLFALWLISNCEIKAQILNYGWTAAATTAANSGTLISGSSTAVDASGNVYTTGLFSGTVDFDPSGGGTANLTSAGGTDLFIQKLDAAGNLVWVKRMGNGDYENPGGIALDASGNVYTTGDFLGTVDFDPNGGTANLTSAGFSDIFIQKLNAAGNLVWAKNMGGFTYDNAYDVAVDAGGNVYTTGIFHALADFDPGANTANLTSPVVGGLYVSHIFISKLDALGNFVWVKGMSGNNHQVVEGIALDAIGNVYTMGYFSGTADFDPNSGTANLSSAGFNDIFIQKLNSSGDYMWAKRMGNAGYENPVGIALDASGNVYTAGSFSGIVDFDPGVGIANLSSAGENHIFIQKLDINGDYVWAKNMGGSSSAYVKDIALDANSNVYTTGAFGVTADLDPSLGVTVNLTSAGGSDIFISKLNALGNYVWAKRMGGSIDDEGNGIAVDANGNVYTTGYFQGSANMNPLGATDTKVGNQYGIFTQKIISCGTTSTINASICSGSSYTFNGIAQSTAATYLDTFVNAAGCDSIVTLHLLVIPNISANVNNTNVNRCSENGTISITPTSGYVLLSSNNFSSAIASPYSITNSASINNGQLQLTAATNSQNGALIYTPSTAPPNGLNVSFDMDMYSNQPAGNNIADGMSFNYGVIPSSPTGNFENGILSSNTGLVIRFKTWQTQVVEVVYNGTVKGTYNVDLHHPMIRKVQVAITPAGLFSMRIGNTILCTNLDLGSSYASDNKSTWKIAWAARTGGAYNRHAIDNIEIMNNNGIEFSIDNWASKTPIPFFSTTTGSYTVQGGSLACASTLGSANLNFNVNNFTSVADSANSNCNGRTITISNTLTMDTLVWSDFASRPTLSNFNDLGNATFSNGSVQLTDNTGSQNGRIVFPQTPNAGVFTATFKARVWDGNNADGFSFNYGQIDNVWGADGGMMNTNTPGLSVCFPTYNTNNIIVKYKNNVLTSVPNTGSGGNRSSFFTPIEVSVNAQYQLTVKWNGTTYISNYDLVANSTFETDAKTNWQFAWGARTGGSFDRHQLDDILVTGKTGLLYSYDGGSTYETNATKTISGTNAVTVVVKADGTCTVNTVSLPAITITTSTFTQVASICAGASLAALPTTSLNGITGIWSPTINNLATTTYTFMPNSSCNPTTTMTITVNPLPIISSVSATPTTICAGDSSKLILLAPSSNTNVSTFAGSGAIGSADGAGVAASFDNPKGVATDVVGNIYVADGSNHKIRKITPSGVVSTFAGSGIAGSADGNGTAASFNSPFGVATDAAGNVYVADYANHKIRKITSAGVVTTLAGSGSSGNTNGTGTAASFNNPIGVATDAAGNVYVADRHNNKIRKITPAGVVTTFAGSGSAGSADGNGTAASFSYPNGVALDAAGNVYVADYFSYKIRKITPSGDVTTLAGSGISGSANGNGTVASFYIPSGVATDAAGNVYVADLGNHKIRKITPSGDVTTFAGSGISGSANGNGTAASFNFPHGIATDATGNVYVADALNHKIRKIVQTIVAPATYTWSGSVNGLSAALDTVSVMPTSTTIYTVTATNVIGCTASSTAQVVVNNSTTGSSTVSTIGSYVFNSITYTASGTYTATFINSAGCDSVHTLILTVDNPFVTVWKTNNLGTSNSTSITIPTTGTGYNYDVDWDNDGIYDQFGITGNVTHNYGTAGTYTVAIKGSFPRIYFNLTGDRQKITSIIQWGDIAWTSMSKAFMGCSNLTYAYIIDNPNLSAVTDMSFMFFNATNFNQNITNWNVGSVTNMSYMFYNAQTFNQPLNNWNVSAVTDMSYMFYNAINFNQNIGSWNVDAVTNMSSMFDGASQFNQNIGSWNVGAVTNMSSMFNDVIHFNQNISGWNVSTVTNMSYMFKGATDFNQNISAWNTNAVTNMNGMFTYARNFNQNISPWNVSAVTDMGSMFFGDTIFNQNISSWNVGAVITMDYMFSEATHFNQNISGWNVSAVTSMSGMFKGATSFNQNISGWNVSAVTNMSGMFQGATSFNQNIGSWNVANVQYMHAMFTDATSFNQNIGPWNVGAVQFMNGMFSGATAFNQNIGNWNVGAVQFMNGMFSGATAFNQNIGSWNVGAVTDMSSMFSGATSFNQNIGSWNLSSISDIYQIFLNSNISQSNYDSILIAWDIAGYSYLYIGNSSPLKYCNGAVARASLLSKGWTITGDALLCLCVPTASIINQSICSGGSYLFNGIYQTTSGTYLDTLVNVDGCDSIVTLNLTVNPSSSNSTAATACNSYTWNGNNYTVSGTYTGTFTNATDCDSVHTLNLVLGNSSGTSTAITANGCYTWLLNNVTYTVGGTYTNTYLNASGCNHTDTLVLNLTQQIHLNVKAFLQGPYFSNTGLMSDSLRVLGLIPLTEPYTAAPFNKTPIGGASGEIINSTVLNVTGNNAIVDWIFLEIRSAANNATVIANKRALIQRDGDIVATDGVSAVTINVAEGNYFVSVKHRNHLGIMTSNAMTLNACATNTIDFTTGTVFTNVTYVNPPRKLIGTVYAMWSSDANNNKNTKYNGSSNDKDQIMNVLGGPAFINNILGGYRTEDCNLNGKTSYNGTDNDRVIILNNVGVSTPNNVIHQHTPN